MIDLNEQHTITLAVSHERTPSRQRISVFGMSFELQAVCAIMLAFLSTRLLIGMIIFLSSVTIPMRVGDYLYASPSNLLLDGLIRDDSWWYANIVTHGYTLGDAQTGTRGTVAFFPLYPIVVKMIAAVTGNVFVAGVLISNVAFIVALSYLYALAQREFDHETAARAVFYLAAAPTAIFFSAMYTESLFVALVCATFFYAREQAWDRAALAGALAAATRNTGVVMAIVIALEGMHAQGVRWRPPVWSRAAVLNHARQQLWLTLKSWRSLNAAACVLLGLIAYMAYLSNTFGDPLAFVHAQSTWGRATAGSGIFKLGSTISTNLNLGPNPLAGQINAQTVFNLLATLGFAPLVVAVALKLRPAYTVFTVLTFLAPLSTGTVGSMTRYILMLVPCFLLLAHWGRHRWVERLILGFFLPLMGYFALLFSHWYFAG